MSAVQYRKASIALATFAVAAGAALVLPGTASAVTQTDQYTIVATTGGYQPTDFVLVEGTPVTVTAEGSATTSTMGTATYYGPNGSVDTCTVDCQNPAGKYGALYARIGNGDPILIGEGPVVLNGAGPLSFAFNDGSESFGDNAGSYIATVTYDDGITPVDPDPGCFGSACFDFMDFFGSSAA
ncbi:hypothetical protein ASG84_24450 [Rhodococcus sp. Leaf278]|uniref:hypothetical protein n=1 Tax=Rhodococcus sp. Leaf278 TaxID=1736319 RepID=UPI00070CFEBC|nr:hypothetical protein [Rhodococcus sp. Leaf278]KQU53338.1 hypothetical protein ASG84_24450 [Rhodococcus sp. Leaf278]